MREAREINRKKILDAAKKIVAEKGAANATLRDIAAEAGISNGALYYYFNSKDIILYEIMDEETEASKKLAEDIRGKRLKPEEIEAEVKRIIISRIRTSEDNRLFFHLAHEAMLEKADLQHKFYEKYQSWFSNVDEIIAALLGMPKNSKTRAIANIILASIDGFCLQRQLGIEYPLEVEWELFKSLILNGGAKLYAQIDQEELTE